LAMSERRPRAAPDEHALARAARAPAGMHKPALHARR
jgi:hypothetical protein